MIKNGYAYLFFFFYNSVNKVKDNILVQWKAVAMIIMLEVILAGGIYCQVINIFKLNLPRNGFRDFIMVIFAVILVGLKLWFFERNENWRKYLAEFEAWPEKNRKRWDWVMRLLIVFIVGNLVLSYYIMSEIDWSQYR